MARISTVVEEQLGKITEGVRAFERRFEHLEKRAQRGRVQIEKDLARRRRGFERQLEREWKGAQKRFAGLEATQQVGDLLQGARTSVGRVLAELSWFGAAKTDFARVERKLRQVDRRLKAVEEVDVEALERKVAGLQRKLRALENRPATRRRSRAA